MLWQISSAKTERLVPLSAFQLQLAEILRHGRFLFVFDSSSSRTARPTYSRSTLDSADSVPHPWKGRGTHPTAWLQANHRHNLTPKVRLAKASNRAAWKM